MIAAIARHTSPPNLASARLVTPHQDEDAATPAAITDLALQQLAAPFECWKFGQLCEAVGPDEAERFVKHFWHEAINNPDTGAVILYAGDRFAAAHDAWLGEWEMSESDNERYEELMGLWSGRSHRTIVPLVCWGGVDNIEYFPSSTADPRVRSRSGVTNLALYASTWANTRYYEGGNNVQADVCVYDGTGYGTTFILDSEGNVIDWIDTPLDYNNKCKTTKKVTVNANWWGTVYNAFGSEACGSKAAFGSTCSCRDSV